MAIPLSIKIFQGDQLVATKDYDRDIIKIGRLSSAHLCLEDDKVSRIHSVLEVGNDGALNIIDMGSVEGTWVNGKRVTKGTLKFGDEIKVGNTRLIIEARQPGNAATPGGTSGEHTVQISQALVDSNSTAVTTASPVPASGLNQVPVSGPQAVPITGPQPLPPSESWSSAVTAAAAAIPGTNAPASSSTPTVEAPAVPGPILTPAPEKMVEVAFFKAAEGSATVPVVAAAAPVEPEPQGNTRQPLDGSFASTEKVKQVEDAKVSQPMPARRDMSRGDGPLGF
jgi:pSer/pThr/pTyr-binding forkhead associated (FHA) protein